MKLLNSRELATVLAALRHYQQYLVDGRSPRAVRDIATDGGRHAPLDEKEIDALCERINTK